MTGDRGLPPVSSINCGSSSTTGRWFPSAVLPSTSSATRSRSTQKQNNSAEPAEYQQQARGGDPAGGGVGQQFRQGEREIGDGEQSGPGVGVAAAAHQAAQRCEQR